MTNRTYLVAGTATGRDGVTKVRWANDFITRFKFMAKSGYKNINLIELPHPMTKPEGLAYLKSLGTFEGEALAAIDFRIEEANEKANYVPKKRGRKPKVKPEISIATIRARKQTENITTVEEPA